MHSMFHSLLLYYSFHSASFSSSNAFFQWALTTSAWASDSLREVPLTTRLRGYVHEHTQDRTASELPKCQWKQSPIYSASPHRTEPSQSSGHVNGLGNAVIMQVSFFNLGWKLLSYLLKWNDMLLSELRKWHLFSKWKCTVDKGYG